MAEFKTSRTTVRIYTSEFIIEGNLHLKLGGYQGRISDLLNQGKTKYLPVTEAKYTSRSGETGEQIESACIIINIDTIEVVDVLE